MNCVENIQYDLAISFAGEDREITEEIAYKIIDAGFRVFYDRNEQANLWGKDLYSYLVDIYQKKSRFCLMIISKCYAQKRWTNHERKAAQARAFSESREYILPLKLDDTEIQGILDTTGYVDYRHSTSQTIVEMLISKLIR